ncbi:MAG: hypothetical protein M3Y82_11930 [Verrucomicrobiota bacterium]|nr:hypothetical protein [Verrucomicrobiota bacterium]
MKKILCQTFIASLLVFSATTEIQAATQYWDLNGATPGAGATPDGFWDTNTANWNSLSDGSGPVAVWTNSNNARFAAGADAVNPYTVTVGTITLGQIGLKEGAAVTFNGGQLTFNHAAGGTSILTGVNGIPTTAVINSHIWNGRF